MNKINKWLFKTFGETNAILWLYGAAVVLYFAFWGTVIYIAYHFISKYW